LVDVALIEVKDYLVEDVGNVGGTLDEVVDEGELVLVGYVLSTVMIKRYSYKILSFIS